MISKWWEIHCNLGYKKKKSWQFWKEAGEEQSTRLLARLRMWDWDEPVPRRELGMLGGTEMSQRREPEAAGSPAFLQVRVKV